MKARRSLYLFAAFTVLTFVSLAAYLDRRRHNPYELATGDIVFQEGFGVQATAVKAATDSRWSHVGIVFERGEELFVLEALQPVRVTPLKKFIARNPESFYAMRLEDRAPITNAAIAKASTWANRQVGKDYDFRFQWDDATMYCSELVWKIYHEGCGIDLCEARPVRDYNLDEPEVAKLIEARYGSNANLPMDHPMVAPSDLARSCLLVEAPRT